MSKQDKISETQQHGRPGMIPQALIRAVNITNEAKVIYGLLSTYKEIFPGQKWIAEHCSCSMPTVITRLRELEARGWLKRERRNRAKKETDIYHIYMAPLKLKERSEWVVYLRKTSHEIDGLEAQGLLNQIKLMRLSKSDLDKKLEPPDAQSKERLEDKEESKEMGNSHKVPLEPQSEKPQKPKAASLDNKKTDYPHGTVQPYKFTRLSDYLAFPDVSFDEKCKNLIKNRATLKRPEMVGMLGDILIQNTVNAKDFLTATRGIKPVYPVIGRMLNEFPLEYLLYFFEGHRIPFKPEAPWSNYLWGAAKRQYAYWSADEEIARSEKVKQEEAESLGELAEMIKEIKESGDDKWQ